MTIAEEPGSSSKSERLPPLVAVLSRQHHPPNSRMTHIPVLSDMLIDERGHLLERLFCDFRREIAQQAFALSIKESHVHLAAGLLILPDEFVGIRARMSRLVVAR